MVDLVDERSVDGDGRYRCKSETPASSTTQAYDVQSYAAAASATAGAPLHSMAADRQAASG